MKDNFNNDNLEVFFSKELQNDYQMDLDSDGWDVPSEKVWDNIASEISSSNRPPINLWRNNRPWMSIAASLLIITIVYQTMTNKQTINNLQHRLNTQVATLNEVQNNEPSDIADFQNSILPNSNDEIKIEKKSTSTISNSIAQISTTKNTTPTTISDEELIAKMTKTEPLPLLAKVHPVSSEINQQVIIATTDEKQISRSQSTSAITKKLESSFTASSFLPLNMDAKKISDFADGSTDYDVKGFYKIIEPLQPKKNRKNWYAGIFYAPSWFSKKIKGENATELKSIVDQQIVSRSSFKTGINIGYQLSDNWSVETGLALSKNKQISEHQLSFTYDPDQNQVNENGDLEAVYSVNLQTSFGDLPSDIRLAHNPNQQMEAGMPITFQLKSEQQLDMLQLPVSIRYSMGEGPLTIRLSGGAMANIVTNNKATINPPPSNYSSSGMQDLRYRNSKLHVNEMQDVKALSCSLTASLELDYELTDNVHLYIAPSYAKGITPVYEDEEKETELLQASVLLGLNYYF